jgi:Leucine-rich repeat (LRR) protein
LLLNYNIEEDFLIGNTSNMNSEFDQSSDGTDDRHGAYADDDSVVSSNVTIEEAQTLTRGGFDIDDANEKNKRAGVMPRNRREWCIVIFAVLLIVAVAAGTGVGLGFYFMNQGGNKNPSPTNKDDKGSEMDDSNFDATDPESLPGTDDFFNATALPSDFAGSIVYHMVVQDISELASFQDIADNGSSSSSPSPQQRARDWLVFNDIVPDNLADEQVEQDLPNTGTDDLINSNSSLSSYLNTNTPAYRVAQRFAVAVFYFATKGEEWDADNQWLQPGRHECDNPGIRCEEVSIPSISLEEALKNPGELPLHSDGSVDTTTERMIVEINLPENNLQGTLTGEMMTFPFLRRLGLWSNQIEGKIPEKIGQLQNLESLLIDDNNFTGVIASEIGSLQNLKMLSLGFNQNMSGGIPDEIGDLYNLEALYLPNMSLRGSLPSSMKNLKNLKNLELQSNRLRGLIPEWLGDLVSLKKLDLSGNAFNGEIPEGFSKLINLAEIHLQDNNLGAIPCSAFETVKLLSANCKSSNGTSCSCCTMCV